MRLQLKFSVQKAKLLLLSTLLCAVSNTFSQSITIGGSGNGLEVIRKLGEGFSKKEVGFKFQILPSIGSGGAAKGLASQKIDMGVMSRPLRDGEKSIALRSVLIAKSPLIVATSRTLEKGLSLNQLEDIYSGKKITWSDGRRIRLVLRPEQDSDTRLLSTLSVALSEALKTAAAKEGMTIAITDQEAASKIESLPDSLGVTTLGLLRSEQRRLAALSLNGVPPMIDGKANSEYPLQKPIFLVTPMDAKPSIQRFMLFIQSPEGLGIIEKNGFLNVLR